MLSRTFRAARSVSPAAVKELHTAAALTHFENYDRERGRQRGHQQEQDADDSEMLMMVTTATAITAVATIAQK